MPYVDPKTVLSPKNAVRNVRVIKNTGDGGWSIARMDWKEEKAIGIRWNGSSAQPGPGNPQSRGKATWLVVPPEIAETQEFQQLLTRLDSARDKASLDGYRRMAADLDREREAREWIEGLERDGLDEAR